MAEAKFIRNAWYMAGWADELAAPQTLLARRFLDEPVVMFRDGAGQPVALQDRCPHRIVPLSKGQWLDGELQCGYHGLRFDASGQCVLNPHGPIPAKARVRAYPLVERHGILWIWMGDARLAAPAQIPDLADLHAEAPTTYSKGAMPTACHYQLVIDNVADLSHVEYLHSGSLGGGAFVGSRPEVAQQGDHVSIKVSASGGKAPPVYAQLLDHPDEPVVFSNEVVWQPVGVLRLNIDVVPAGPNGGRTLQTRNVHIVTPESATRTHYWYWLTRGFCRDDLAMTQRRTEQMSAVFLTEDKPMLEAQQALLGTQDLFEADPLLLPTDGGAVRARRVIARLLAADQQPVAAPAVAHSV